MVKAPTAQQRAVDATSRLRQVLEVDDLKMLSTALAEVAADEAKHNPDFARRIRDVYQELIDSAPKKRTPPAKETATGVALVPLPGTEGLRVDPFAPLDPYLLTRIYGSHQLRAALGVYSLPKLKQALAVVEERHPDAKPKSKGQKQAVLDYIVEHVAGPGY